MKHFLRRETPDEKVWTPFMTRMVWSSVAQVLGVTFMFTSMGFPPSLGLRNIVGACFGLMLMVSPFFFLFLPPSFGTGRNYRHFVADRKFTMIAVAVGMASIACMLLSLVITRAAGLWWGLAAIGCGSLLLFAAVGLLMWPKIRTASVVRDRNFLICPHCRYDLRHLPGQGACPECGEPYCYDELPRIWKQQMGE